MFLFYTIYTLYTDNLLYTAKPIKHKLRRFEARGLALAVKKLQRERLRRRYDAIILIGGRPATAAIYDKRLHRTARIRKAKRRAVRRELDRQGRDNAEQRHRTCSASDV